FQILELRREHVAAESSVNSDFLLIDKRLRRREVVAAIVIERLQLVNGSWYDDDGTDEQQYEKRRVDDDDDERTRHAFCHRADERIDSVCDEGRDDEDLDGHGDASQHDGRKNDETHKDERAHEGAPGCG